MMVLLCRRLGVLLAVLVVGSALVSGCEGEKIHRLYSWIEYDVEFAMPAKQAWRNGQSATTSAAAAHHAMYDLFLQKGQQASIETKFHYGNQYLTLNDESVGMWIRKADGFGWTHVGDALTDTAGEIVWPYPATWARDPGTYFVKFVVYGDLTTANGIIRVVEKTVKAAVFDIDGTLTTMTDAQAYSALSQFADPAFLPRMQAGANKVAVELAQMGYDIFYVTGRPHQLHATTRNWLKIKGFPLGVINTYRDSTNLFLIGGGLSNTNTQRVYKQNILNQHVGNGAKFDLAFGDSSADVSAYDFVSIPKNKTYTLGADAGQGGTLALASYTNLFGNLVPTRDDRYHVALVIVDGLRPDALRLYIDSFAPANSPLKRIFGTSIETQQSATTGPSVTFAGHASIASGTHPRRHGVSGNGFMDRKTVDVYDFVSTVRSVDDVLATYSGTGLANQALVVPTIYEQMHGQGKYGVVSGHMYFRGAEYLYPTLTQLIQYITDAREYDASLMTNLLDRLQDGVDIPDMMTIYMPGLDHEAHEVGGVGGETLSPANLTNTQLEYLHAVIDPQLQRLENTLNNIGILNKTVFVICSDHGHANVGASDAYAVTLDPFDLADEVEYIIEDPHTPFVDVYDKPLGIEGDFDSHAGLNGAFMQITLRNTLTQNWMDQPRWIEEVLPVIGSIQKHRIDGQLKHLTNDMVEEVLVRQGFHQPYQVVRPTRVRITYQSVTIAAAGGYFLDLRVGDALLKRHGKFTIAANETIPLNLSYNVDVMPGMDFRVVCHVEKDNTFSYDSIGTSSTPYTDRSQIVGQTVTQAADTNAFSLTFKVEVVSTANDGYPHAPGFGHLCPLSVMNPDYVKGPERIQQLHHPYRSGDIIVLSKWRSGYYFGGTNASNHGSLYPEDSYQTFSIGGPPVTTSRNFGAASGADIAPTIAKILGIRMRNIDGTARTDVSLK